MLLDKLNNLDMTTGDYADPSWAFKQAHYNGIRQGLTEVLELLNFVPDKG